MSLLILPRIKRMVAGYPWALGMDGFEGPAEATGYRPPADPVERRRTQ